MKNGAESYLKLIIKNQLANMRNVYPSEISTKEINVIYETDGLPGFTLHQNSVTSWVNGKEKTSIVAAIIDKTTGEWYYTHVLKEENKENN